MADLSTILLLLPPKIPIPDRQPGRVQVLQQGLGIAATGLEKVAHFGQADLSFLAGLPGEIFSTIA